MHILFKNLILILSAATLVACETVPVAEQSDTVVQQTEESEIPTNPAVVQAQSELARAKSMGSEWLVRAPEVAARPISLSKIMELALMYHENGEVGKATKYAQVVSKFARLGIAQAHRQSDALPYYPQ